MYADVKPPRLIKCLVADDEPCARQVLEGYVLGTPGLVLAASCGNALETLHAIESQVMDLLFLDIELPLAAALTFLSALEYPPHVVFTTAYLEHTAQTWALDTVHYLLKPFCLEQFLLTVQKIGL
jgi:DNA-binding LytR/AlgR family response regulator